jgi:tryptophanyl-tRNA synthetase
VVGAETSSKLRVMSGMRPTGRLHIGHLVGALTQWVELAKTAEAFYEVADLHALTTGFADTGELRANVIEMVRDWLAAGVTPSRATIYVQSRIPEIPELHVLLSMITPVSWLQRVPTYKEQIEQLGGEIATYGFLGYPLLQTVDVAAMQANRVPVGRDQLAHLEFGREVVRRFNHLYGSTLVEAEATLSEFPAMPGTDGRKMSKSYGNTIDIADDDATTTKKVRGMFTDPQKIRKNDPGRPEVCPVFALHHLSNQARVPWIAEHCRSGALGCVQCKGELAETMNQWLRPIRERRAQISEAEVVRIIDEGSEKARAVASQTLQAAKRAIRLP